MDTIRDAAAADTRFWEDKRRSRDLARDLGLSEGALVARHDGPEVVRLRADARALLDCLPALGEVLSLTRNEAAVHEIVGAFAHVSLEGRTGMVLNPPLDLRLFTGHWVHVLALELPDEKGPRRSVQIFDAAGEAVLKVHLRPASDHAAFAAMREALAFGDGDVPAFEQPSGVAPAGAGPQDGEAFREDIAGMRDVHQFVPILKRYGVDRRAALDAMPEGDAVPLGKGAATALLTAASGTGVPIMCFVGNPGCIQIFTGRVANVKAMGPWINVLDPGFDLHLREDLVAEAFAVRKPTRDGALTSVELYDGQRTLVCQFFGERPRGEPENPAWREIVAGLPRGS